MRNDIQKARDNFTALYQAQAKDSANSLHRQQLLQLYRVVGDTGDYLDSLKLEMDKMNEMEVNNSYKVKAIFMYKGAGDSIINKFNRTISMAMVLAKTEEQKALIAAASQNLFNEADPNKWKENQFGMLSSLGASMIIYGFQSQLYQVGTAALGFK